MCSKFTESVRAAAPADLTEHGNGSVVVAVVAMGVMQAPVDQVIIMVAVRHPLVTAAIVSALAGNRVTAIRVLRTDFNHMLIEVIIVRVMQMPVVQIIYMIAVLDAGMTTVFAMHMRVRFVFRTRHRRMFFHCTGEPQAHCLRSNAGIVVQGAVPCKLRAACPTVP